MHSGIPLRTNSFRKVGEIDSLALEEVKGNVIEHVQRAQVDYAMSINFNT